MNQENKRQKTNGGRYKKPKPTKLGQVPDHKPFHPPRFSIEDSDEWLNFFDEFGYVVIKEVVETKEQLETG